MAAAVDAPDGRHYGFEKRRPVGFRGPMSPIGYAFRPHWPALARIGLCWPRLIRKKYPATIGHGLHSIFPKRLKCCVELAFAAVGTNGGNAQATDFAK